MYPKETQEQFLRLRAKGKSIRAIAAELNINPSTAVEWNRKFSAQVAAACREELESALEEHAVVKVRRFRVVARAFNKVESYIRNCYNIRDNTGVFELLMKLDRYLDDEIRIPDQPPATQSNAASFANTTPLNGRSRKRKRVNYVLVHPDDLEAKKKELGMLSEE